MFPPEIFHNMYIHMDESMNANASRCVQFLKLDEGEAGHLVPGLV